ncbi:hydrogenase nickel incorporation protein HypB [Zoogloeaceae bacterium G21618-S1]|nr:hydrogenase nickel incorporation protein HypB [Zoogloeaceae bacterium G21618-S1]
MCTVCGCGAGEVMIGRPNGTAQRKRAPTTGWKMASAEPAHDHSHDHGEAHAPASDHAGHMHFGHGPAHAHAPGLSQHEMLRIEQDILGKNDRFADANRQWLAGRGIFALNLVSSPGSGKTTLLCKTIEILSSRVLVAVIEGDQQTEFDAERIRATGAPALQINTGKGCHLDAAMVGQALPRLSLIDNSLLLIENVGNLVCPSAFDLGEAHKVVILSVTEGEDKPLKYPDMFAAADVMLLNKTDLLPYVRFDADKAVEFALRVNPRLKVFRVSATTGEGFDGWLAWIESGLAAAAGGSQNDHKENTLAAGY